MSLTLMLVGAHHDDNELLAGTIALLATMVSMFFTGEVQWRFFNAPEQGSITGNFAMLEGSSREETLEMMREMQRATDAVAAEQGHVEEAEAVYRADLGLGGHLRRATVHPDNIWSLKGLHDCLKARDDTVEILQIRQRLDLAAARADRAVAASCFCAQAAMKAAE